jgi:HK97 family phage prohead protease
MTAKANQKSFEYGKIKSIDQEKRQAIFIFSDGLEDRHGDSLNPQGWKVENYMKNPVVLFGHNYRDLPVGKTVKTWVENGKQLLGLIEFATHEFAEDVWQLVVGEFLNAGSVGFIPLKWDETGEYTFAEMELLEYSIVPVPANPRALGKKELELYKSLEERTSYQLLKEENTNPEESEKPLTPKEVAELVQKSVTEALEANKKAEEEAIKKQLEEDSEKAKAEAAATVRRQLEALRDYVKTSDKAIGLALRTIKEINNQNL